MTYHNLLLMWCGSLVQAAISTVISIIFALPIVHFLSQYTFYGKKFIFSLFAFFCIMPTKLCALAIKLFYGVQGLPGIISAHVLLNLPFACYLLHTAYEKIDWLMVWAAADLGASVWQQYKDAILPQIKPALLLTSLSIFLLCFSSFSIPRMLGTHIYHYTPDVLLFFANNGGDQETVQWCFFLRLLTMVPLGFLYNYFLQQRAYVPIIHIPHKKNVIVFNTGELKWLVYSVFILCLLIGPLIALFMNALQYNVPHFLYNNFWSIDPLLTVSISSVLYSSIIIAAISSVGSLLLGSLFASLQLFIPRYMSILMHAIVLFPLFIGNVVIGVLSNAIKLVAPDTLYVMIIISHIIVNYPFVYRIIAMQLYAYPQQLTQLAQASGASSCQIFYTVLLPFIRSALKKAWLIAFGLSLIEVGASTVLANNRPLTIPLAMRLYYTQGQLDGFLGISFILLAIMCTISFFVDKYSYCSTDK